MFASCLIKFPVFSHQCSDDGFSEMQSRDFKGGTRSHFRCGGPSMIRGNGPIEVGETCKRQSPRHNFFGKYHRRVSLHVTSSCNL